MREIYGFYNQKVQSGHCLQTWLALGPGETAGKIRTPFTATADGLGSAPSAWQRTTSCSSSSSGSNALSWPPWALHTHGAPTPVQQKHSHRKEPRMGYSRIRWTRWCMSSCPVWWEELGQPKNKLSQGGKEWRNTGNP